MTRKLSEETKSKNRERYAVWRANNKEKRAIYQKEYCRRKVNELNELKQKIKQIEILITPQDQSP